MNRTDIKFKVAIIGCGQISDAHLKELSMNRQVDILAVCDLNLLLAQDTAERFNIKHAFSDYLKMLEKIDPDVVHITTPPQTHLSIGSKVLKNGCHAYIEKPFGTSYDEAETLINTAKSYKRIVCAGFSQLYDVVSKRVNRFIQNGRIGDIVHVETYYGDSLAGNFSKLFLQNKEHWIHNLPGKMFQNVISHALYHIVPFFPDKIDKVVCLSQDRSKNGVLADELRVMLKSENVTGYLTYTNAVNPLTQFYRLYGTKSIIQVDLSNHIVSSISATNLPGPIARVRNGIIPGKNLIREGIMNLKNLISGRDRFFAGMGNLFNHFYECIRSGDNQPPVPYSYVLKHAVIMDEIAKQCGSLQTNNHAENLR